MQPSYGLPQSHQDHHQQLAMDGGCCSSVFSASDSHHNQNHHHLYQFHPQHLQQQKQPQHIFQEHLRQQQIPITHQLFQQHNQYQAFQHQNDGLQHSLRLEHEPTGQASHPFLTVNFKLGLNENSGNNEGVLNQEGSSTFLRGNEPHVTQNRHHSLVVPHCWHPQEDPAIKEPFWKPLERKLIGTSNSLCNEDKEQEIHGTNDSSNKQPIQEVDDSSERCQNLENKYGLFGELEAIYTRAKIAEANQTGSGSALTGENSPTMPYRDVPRQNVATGDGNTAIGVDHDSETSIGEEASVRKTQKRKRKRKLNEKLGSIAGFFESLVKRLMDHQDGLHEKFLEVIERMDKERTKREELWRRQEVSKHNREAIARAHEQALASNREAVIVSYIEKITGQSVDLPSRKTPSLLQPEFTTKEAVSELIPMKVDANSRWPKAEVEALIQVRSCLETRFQEPGLKGPLWEEVSSIMASMGYQRSAKRCKEKWENINKYFRKAKESGKKRSPNSKTCPYFDRLDQLYSKTSSILPSLRPFSKSDDEVQRQGYSELLEAFISGKDLGAGENSSDGYYRVAETGSSKSSFHIGEKAEVGNHEKEKENLEYSTDGEEDDSNDEDGGDEGE